MKHAARLFVVSVLSCAASSVAAADAAAGYPSRPIRFIAPFVAGGPSDTLSRLLAQKLTESWGQTVLVDNRGSGGGIIGFELGAKAPPDGYTLLLANGAGLTKELIRILRLPEIQERFRSQGLDAVGSSPEELAALIKNEVVMYAKLVKQIGLKPQ